MPDRHVRFTDSSFDRLDSLLPDERGAAGSPSAADFLLYELPRIRDLPAIEYEANTLATDDPDIRVYIGGGVLVEAVAVYAARTGDVVEVV